VNSFEKEISVEVSGLEVLEVTVGIDLRASVESVETAVQASFLLLTVGGSIRKVDLATVLAVVVDLEEDVDVVVLRGMVATISCADSRDEQVVVMFWEASDPRLELEGAVLVSWASDVVEHEWIDCEIDFDFEWCLWGCWFG